MANILPTIESPHDLQGLSPDDLENLAAEMRQALCHVQVPEQPEDIAPIIASAFQALTGEPLQPRCDVHVCRLARGGMSSGMVSGRFWSDTFIPLLQSRAGWLQTIWMAPQR